VSVSEGLGTKSDTGVIGVRIPVGS